MGEQIQKIQKEMDLLEGLETRSWLRLSHLLDSIDNSQFWRYSAESFTEWLSHNSSKLGGKPSTLWRFLAAGRYIEQLKSKLRAKGIALIELDSISDKVSPENIELLGKIERAIPEEQFWELAQKVFTGKITRAELRSTWEIYRPIFEGKTARGRGALKPRLNYRDPAQYSSITEAILQDVLTSEEPKWLGYDDIKTCKVMTNITPSGLIKSKHSHLYTAVAVVKRSKSDEVELHGIMYVTPKLSDDIILLRKIIPDSQEVPESIYCDYLWYISLASKHVEKEYELWTNELPDFIGLLKVGNAQIGVCRRASCISHNSKLREHLLTALLVRLI